VRDEGADVDVAELLEIELIKQLKYRYMRCVDQKLWQEIVGCFTVDATVAYDGGRYQFVGRDAIVEFLSRSMSERKLTSHRVHQPEIRLDGPARATGTWAMEDAVMDLPDRRTIRGAGFYDDVYVKLDDEWKIASTGYQRTYVELHAVERRAGYEPAPAWWFAGASESEREALSS
jgi:hypothetical protein